jgi:hypothetical protein
MYSKSSKFIFSLLIVGFLLFCSYVVYQFILYENYSSGRWKTKYCGMDYPVEYRRDCVFGEECVYPPTPVTKSVAEIGAYPVTPRKTCRPRMYDLMEHFLGEED